jgi:LytR cell envelope-related transcriptional attenuator
LNSYASASSLPTTRWRTATLVASTVAVLELAALLAIGTVMLGRSVAHHVREAAVTKVAGPPPVRQTAPAPAKLSRSETGVLVLNGNGVAGAAATNAARVRGLGYLVAGVGNASEPSPRTLVMYRPGFVAEARRFARDAHAKLVTPLDGMRPRDLMGAELVLVVGA